MDLAISALQQKIAAPVLRELESQARSEVTDKPTLTLGLNIDKLERGGIIEYVLPEGTKDVGIEVRKAKQVDETTLKFQRVGRIAATTSAVGLNIWSIFSLFQAAFKLISHSLYDGDVEEAYKDLGKAYAKSSIAGGLTGIANESPFWAIGNLGMGIFSRYLDKIGGLATFSISDGLASIGMGQVRYRDGQNAFAVQHSIFNSPNLSKLNFLIPVEQAVISFAKRFVSPCGWQRFSIDEPYALFQSAGGGLISAGGLLGVASLFKNKMSEALRSFAYVPYSLFSLVNLIALFRDGKVVLERANDFGGRKNAEAASMHVEGYSKVVAAPILAVNNLLLALKGVGIDTQNNIVYNLAMASRACGAASAFLGFTAQSALRFFKPDLFGPRFKQYFELLINPKLTAAHIFEFIKGKRPHEPHASDKFDPIIAGDAEREILHLLIGTDIFKSLQQKSQAGLPNPHSVERSYLGRYTHSKRVCAISILMFNALLKNTKSEPLRAFLNKHATAFKIACLLHDIGHISRSHLAEKAIKGHNNDELTMKMLKAGSKLHDIIVEYYSRKFGAEAGTDHAEAILQDVRNIIGYKSPLSKLLKIADFTEYARSNGGDFACVDGFTPWTIEQIEDYADTLRLVDKQREVQLAFTEDGAEKTFELYYDRLKFNAKENYDPRIVARELTYLLGIDASDLSLNDVIRMNEERFDTSAEEGVRRLNGDRYCFPIKIKFGGETAYCGYPSPRNYILLESGEEYLAYIERVVRKNNPQRYRALEPKIKALTVPQEVELWVTVSNNGSKITA